jgi:hypothetical protein
MNGHIQALEAMQVTRWGALEAARIMPYPGGGVDLCLAATHLATTFRALAPPAETHDSPFSVPPGLMSEPSKSNESACAEDAVEREREFMDVDGTRWRVREMPFSLYDRRRGRSLIFWSDGAVRRVRDYPPNWHELSDEDLARLSWKI